MSKFKEFLLSEQAGLGNLGMRIDQAMGNPDLNRQITSAMNAEPPVIIGPDSGQGPSIQLPTMERTARITNIMTKKNPIYVRLSDGTEMNFTYDQFRRIKGEPAVGKTMRVIFQRNENGYGQSYSKVDKAIVLD